MDAEFVLKNASVIEGSGLTPYKGHIHVADGEIKAIHKKDSELPKNKVEIVDLKGVGFVGHRHKRHLYCIDKASGQVLFFRKLFEAGPGRAAFIR